MEQEEDGSASLYSKLFQDVVLKLPPNPFYCSRVYHLYVIHVKDRDRLQQYLRNAEIDTQIHYPIPLHLQKHFNLGMAEGSLFLLKSLHSKFCHYRCIHILVRVSEHVASRIAHFMTKPRFDADSVDRRKQLAWILGITLVPLCSLRKSLSH
jgi:dTDP-4-amino-4,6-dideoxygalactose transaminase